MSTNSQKLSFNSVGCLILCNSTNLYSAYCDAVNLYRQFSKLNVPTSNFRIGFSVQSDKTKFIKKFPECISVVFDMSNLTNLGNTIRQFCSLSFNCLFLFLSSHGYSGKTESKTKLFKTESDGVNEYIVVNGNAWIDDDIHNCVVNIPLSLNKNVFALIDTCSSGTMLDLPWTFDGKVWKQENNNNSNSKNSMVQAFSISACLDNQSSMDDISSFGYGGGLTSAFLDWLSTSNVSANVNVIDLFNQISSRLKLLKQTAVLSSTVVANYSNA